MSNYEERWEVIEELGAGGQGKVYRVRDKKRRSSPSNLQDDLIEAVNAMTIAVDVGNTRQKGFSRFRSAILELVEAESPENQGALKVLHDIKDAREPQFADHRVQREIEAMSRVSHPNLLEILDSDPEGRWYVSEFHTGGVLLPQIGTLAGDFSGVLRAVRPLVEGVSKLHEAAMVHRDIKPENVFLASDGRLVLGDFGLVFFQDDDQTRISQTLENVGTRDWMPGWATGMRIEDIKPTFDVFSLGKVIWALTAGRKFLQLWYYDKSRFNVEQSFPDAPNIRHANPFFAKCIVEGENNCLADATELLDEIDAVLMKAQSDGDYIGDGSNRPCRVCSAGTYDVTTTGGNRAFREIENFGLQPEATRTFRIFSCNNCGHVQLFSFRGNQLPPAWKN